MRLIQGQGQLQFRMMLIRMAFLPIAFAAYKFPPFQPKAKGIGLVKVTSNDPGTINTNFSATVSAHDIVSFQAFYSDATLLKLVGFKMVLGFYNPTWSVGWAPFTGNYGTTGPYSNQVNYNFATLDIIYCTQDPITKRIKSIGLHGYGKPSIDWFGEYVASDQQTTWDLGRRVLIGFNSSWLTGAQYPLAALQPVVQDKLFDCNYLTWTPSDAALINASQTAPIEVGIGSAGFDVLFTPSSYIPDCSIEIVMKGGTGDFNSGSTATINKDSSVLTNFRTDDTSLDGQVVQWYFYIRNPDYKYFEVGQVDGQTQFSIFFKFKLIAPLLPLVAPADFPVTQTGNLYFDVQQIIDFSWNVPRAFYKLTKVTYWTDAAGSFLNGFQLQFTCEVPEFVTAGWATFQKCFGTCYSAITPKSIDIPLDKEIVQVQLCTGIDAFQMMSFKLSDGTLVTPTGIDLSYCQDNTFYDLTGRLIGFHTKQCNLPEVGDKYTVIRQIQPIVNTNDCVTTIFAPTSPVPNKVYQQGDPLTTFDLPPVTNSLQMKFNDKIQCTLKVKLSPVSSLISITNDFTKLSYYVKGVWDVGLQVFNIIYVDKSRESLGFKTGMKVTGIQRTTQRLNQYVETQRVLPDSFTVTGTTAPYITKVEAQTCGTSCNIQGVRLTFYNGRAYYSISSGLPGGSVGSPTYTKTLTAISQSSFFVMIALPNILTPLPFYMYSIGLGSQTVTGLDMSDAQARNDADYYNEQFICGISEWVDASGILRSFDIIRCLMLDSLSPIIPWTLTVQPCGAACLSFDPNEDYVGQTHWSLYSTNGPETAFKNIWDQYLDSTLDSSVSNTKPYLVINFMKTVLVQGVWLQTNSLKMNSGAFDVRVADTIDLNSPQVVCPGSAASGIGINAAGGAFNCGLYGKYLIINCYGGCSMSIEVIKVWRKKIVSVGAVPSLFAGETFLAQSNQYQDLQNFIGTGSVPCLSEATSFNIDKGMNARAVILLDLGSPVRMEKLWLSQYSGQATMAMRVWLSNSPWIQTITNLDPQHCLVTTDVSPLPNNFGQIEKACTLIGRYAAVWKQQTYTSLSVCKLIMIGTFCNEEPITVDANYVWPSIKLATFGVDTKVSGPVVDQGCIEASQAGYSMTFTEAATMQLVNWIQFDLPTNKFVVNASLKEFSKHNNQIVMVIVTIVPFLTMRPSLSGMKITVEFGDIRPQYCGQAKFIPYQDPLLFQTSVRSVTPVYFKISEVADQASFDLGDSTGTQACGPRSYTFLSNPAFLTQDPLDPLSFRLQSTNFDEEGLQIVILRVTLKDFPSAIPYDLRISCQIDRCKVLEIRPKDPKMQPSNVYMVSYPNQSFPISRFIPYPLCAFQETDFTYDFSEQTGSFIPKWLKLSTKGENILMTAIPDLSFNQNTYKLVFKVTNVILNIALEFRFDLAVRLPVDPQVAVISQQVANQFQLTQTVDTGDQKQQSALESEIQQLQEKTGVSSNWTGWMILLEAKQKISTTKSKGMPFPPKAQIESISKTGVVIIKFSKPMVVFKDLQQLFTASQIDQKRRILTDPPQKHEFTVDPVPSQESDIAKLRFTYQAEFVDSKTLKISLFFENAPSVSSNFDSDWLSVHLSSLLIDAEDGLSILPENQVLTKTLPPQMPRNAATVAVEVASQSIQIASGGALASNAFINILLQGSLNQVWSVLNNIQMIVVTPLINVQYPGNAFNVYSVMITIASFDILPTDRFYPYFFPLPEQDEPFNENFDNLGFGSSYFVGNFGSALLGVLWLLLMYLLYPFIKCCGSNPRRKWCRRKAENMKNTLFWHSTTLFIVEAYLDVLICSLVNLSRLDRPISTFGVALSAALSVLLTLCCIAVPLVTVFYLRPRFGQLQESRFQERFGSIYEMINLKGHQSAILWPIIFCIRRSIFAIAVVFTQNPVLQLMAFTYPTLAVMILLGLAQPLESLYDNRVEMFDSVTVLLLSYCLFCFTDFVPDPNIRYQIGFWMILMTCQNIFINIYLMSRDPFKKLIAKFKSWYANPQALRKKLSISYFRKKTIKLLDQKRKEIKESLLLESDMSVISEHSEEEESDLEEAFERAWADKYVAKPVIEQTPQEEVNHQKEVVNPEKMQIRKAKVQEVELHRVKEKRKQVEEMKSLLRRSEQSLKGLDRSHSSTKNRLSQKADRISQQSQRRKLRMAILRIEPQASFLNDSIDEEVCQLVRNPPDPLKAAHEQLKEDVQKMGRKVKSVFDKHTMHGRTDSDFPFINKKTNLATDEPANQSNYIIDIPDAKPLSGIPSDEEQRQQPRLIESPVIINRRELANQAMLKYQAIQAEKANLRENIFQLTMRHHQARADKKRDDRAQDISLIIGANRVLRNARDRV